MAQEDLRNAYERHLIIRLEPRDRKNDGWDPTMNIGDIISRDLKNELLMARQYQQTGVFMDRKDADTLRRAETTLHRWAERVCGWTTEYGTAALVRDEITNIPYHDYQSHYNRYYSYVDRVNDLETGALRRVAEVCKRNGLEYFHQQDPRGCSLYISKIGQGMNDTNYSSFVACSVR